MHCICVSYFDILFWNCQVLLVFCAAIIIRDNRSSSSSTTKFKRSTIFPNFHFSQENNKMVPKFQYWPSLPKSMEISYCQTMRRCKTFQNCMVSMVKIFIFKSTSNSFMQLNVLTPFSPPTCATLRFEFSDTAYEKTKHVIYNSNPGSNLWFYKCSP